jgi:succinate dehydrogenase / fumarate reductase cytochrome b subunit
MALEAREREYGDSGREISRRAGAPSIAVAACGLGHRITGATIFFFLFVHVLDTALVRVSPEAYNEVIDTYKTPIVGLMEVGLVAAVLYHALNGIRVILIDFWQHGPRYQRLMLWVVAAVWLAVMIPALGVLGMHMAERFL